jgi:pimeloyl-ACP methyl ester carboxylesterase
VILVCHGASSERFSDDGYAPLLEAGYALLTPSRPGYGRTPLNVGATAAEAAEALVALLDRLEIDSCTVMAISGGGPTGVALAAGRPKRVRRLTPADIQEISRFYQRRSSRAGALNDLTHTVGKELLQKVQAPTLIIHSREDKSAPFGHADWSLAHIPQAELCESGFSGHFCWIGPAYPRASQRLVDFLRGGPG